jgi:hypothetical protein
VVVAKSSLQREGGDNFALLVLDVVYTMNTKLADPKEADDTLVAVGAKFSNLGLEDMKIVVEQTKFYKTPVDAIVLFEKKQFQTETLDVVLKFCSEHGMLPEGSKLSDASKWVGFENDAVNLNFTTKYLKQVK